MDPTEDKDVFPPALMERIGFLLAMVKGGAEVAYGKALEPLGLHVRQVGLLTVLATEGPRSQQELSAWMRLDRTTMVALVDALEERGYVRRDRNPDDRRAYLLQLTDAGRDAQKRGTKTILAAERAFFTSLTDAERDQLRALLAKVAVDAGRLPADG